MEIHNETFETVSYHDIEPAKLFDGKVDGRSDILFIPDVGFDGQCFHTREPLLDQGCTFFSCWKVYVYQQDVCALFCEEE